MIGLVTGASGAVGSAVARRIAPTHRRLHLVARQRRPLEELATSLPSSCVLHRLDLSVMKERERLVEELADDPPDHVILATAFAAPGSLEEQLLHVDAQIQLEIAQLVRLATALMPSMGAKGHGRIVALGSAFARRPSPEVVVYSVLKAALHTTVETLAAGASPGVSLNTVVPGPMKSVFADAFRKRVAEWRGISIEEFDAKRGVTFVPPSAVADAIAELLDAASAVNGQEIHVGEPVDFPPPRRGRAEVPGTRGTRADRGEGPHASANG